RVQRVQRVERIQRVQRVQRVERVQRVQGVQRVRRSQRVQRSQRAGSADSAESAESGRRGSSRAVEQDSIRDDRETDTDLKQGSVSLSLHYPTVRDGSYSSIVFQPSKPSLYRSLPGDGILYHGSDGAAPYRCDGALPDPAGPVDSADSVDS